MERPLWDRIQAIYHSSLSLAPSERSAFVESACAQDPHLMREVKSLLDADESSGDFLESSVFEIGLKIITSSHSSSAPKSDDSSMDDLIGTTIDRYLVEKKLGEGGMGKVYLARELSLHSRPVVIKILLEESLQNPYLRQKFEQEVEALSRLNHPNVVSVLGDGELSGKPYIVMQYVSGLTLRSQIPNEGMNLERAASILKQIGAALDYVHEQGIFHRDLKPDNIMLQRLKGGTEFVMVVDFGIAKVKDSVVAPSTADNIAIGTAQYMSPEQLRGGEKITAASDVYSMAVMAYEMVTGRRPFNPTSTAQLLELQRNGVRVRPVDLRAKLSTEAQAIILRGLSFERTARYQDAAEFCNSLARALMNEEEIRNLSDPERIQAAAELPKSGAAGVNINGEKDGRSWWRKRFTLIGSLAVVACLAVLFAVIIRKGQTEVDNPVPRSTPTPTPLPTRSLVYWLEVEKIRNGKAQRIFQSTNLGVFETGDKFRLNVSCSEPGYLYLFNEGTPEPRNTSFTIIYPTPETNNGSASIGKNQPLQTNWNTFSGRPGTENFWIIWSPLPISELESAKIEAFKHRDGGLTGETLDTVKKFLTTKAAEVNVKTSRDKQTQRTTLHCQGDVLVKLVEFEHR
jgi:serine/threonine protein kinase